MSKGDPSVKLDLEELLRGGRIRKMLDDRVAFHMLDRRPDAL